MKTPDTRQTLCRTLRSLEIRYSALMRGRMVPTPRAIALRKEIDAIKEQIADIDRDAAQRLALSRAPVDEVLEVIALPLLADVMNDLVTSVDATLRRHGVQQTVFSTYTTAIRRNALAMVDTLDHADESLPRLLDVDDTLVDAVRKKLMSFIRQRLKITKQ